MKTFKKSFIKKPERPVNRTSTGITPDYIHRMNRGAELKYLMDFIEKIDSDTAEIKRWIRFIFYFIGSQFIGGIFFIIFLSTVTK